MTNLEDVEFDHEKAISEESLSNADLSADIKAKIKAFNMQRGRVSKKGDKITEKDIANLESMSIKIANDIYDHLEAELEELEKEEKLSNKKDKQQDATQVVYQEPVLAPVNNVEDNTAQTPPTSTPKPVSETQPKKEDNKDDDFVLFDGLV